MREHVASGIVGIIGDKETSWQGSRWHLVQGLNKLSGFASGSGAHVEHLVVRLHSQHQGRQHWDGLLPGYRPNIGLSYEEAVQLLILLPLLDLLPGEVELVGATSGNPWQDFGQSNCLVSLVCGCKLGEEGAFNNSTEPFSLNIASKWESNGVSPCIYETKSRKTFHTRDLFNTTQNTLLIQCWRLNFTCQPLYRILFLQTNSQTTISGKQCEFRIFLSDKWCWKIFIVDHIFQSLVQTTLLQIATPDLICKLSFQLIFFSFYNCLKFFRNKFLQSNFMGNFSCKLWHISL